jgi:tRNA(adenine34) deaminase
VSNVDAVFMQAALQQAQLAAVAGEVPVGAVLVASGEVVAAGHNRTLVDHDPSGHAEIVVLRQAAISAGNHRLVDATLYVTLEPCAMCVGAIVQARIARVVFGAYDQKAGALGSAIDLSDSSAFNHRFEIQGGLLADDSAAILKDFFAARR